MSWQHSWFDFLLSNRNLNWVVSNYLISFLSLKLKLSFIFTDSKGNIQLPRKYQSLRAAFYIKPEDACCTNNKFSLAWTVNIDGNKTLRLTLIVLKDQERKHVPWYRERITVPPRTFNCPTSHERSVNSSIRLAPVDIHILSHGIVVLKLVWLLPIRLTVVFVMLS